MITFISGDLLQAGTEYIAQGVAVGSQEGMGTGLALKISMTWPEVQAAFKRYTRNSKFEGGDIFVVKPAAGHPGVIYIATQPDMYHATLPFLNRGLRNLAKYCARHDIGGVGLPKIGAGLGKLSWTDDVKPLMIRHFTEGSTLFIIHEDFRNELEG